MSSYNECKEIAELDLDPIKVKLMHKESGEGWSLEQANAVETEYRRFLYLMKIFPNEMAAPSIDVDTFWHYHILDTMKYSQDCEYAFGYFLHHFPYAGLRGPEDLAAHEQLGERMAELYENTFGEKYRGRLITPVDAQAPDNATAYSVRSTTAYSVRSTTAYSVRPTAAYSVRAATAYSVRGTTFEESDVKQAETERAIHTGAIGSSMNSKATGRKIEMNSFFLTRPRVAAQANAN